MRLYTYPAAPSPRRIHLFLAEKGVQIEQTTVDLATGEHLKAEFAAVNPALTVPALVLDDGSCLAESVAICDYLESLYPDPPLIGRSALERARVIERDHWIEWSGLMAVMEAFRNRSRAMSDHALTGSRPVAQIPELAKRGIQRYQWFLHDLDALLANNDYLAGEHFSMADITAFVVIEFAGWGIRQSLPDELSHVRRWQHSVAQRPAIAASPLAGRS